MSALNGVPGATTVQVSVLSSGMAVWDADRRIYLADRESSSGVHVVQPADPTHALVRDGKRRVGDLICCCPGGSWHGSCWAIAKAEAYEAEMADDARWAALWATVPTGEAVHP